MTDSTYPDCASCVKGAIRGFGRQRGPMTPAFGRTGSVTAIAAVNGRNGLNLMLTAASCGSCVGAWTGQSHLPREERGRATKRDNSEGGRGFAAATSDAHMLAAVRLLPGATGDRLLLAVGMMLGLADNVAH